MEVGIGLTRGRLVIVSKGVNEPKGPKELKQAEGGVS